MIGGSFPANATFCANTFQRLSNGKQRRINHYCIAQTTIG